MKDKNKVFDREKHSVLHRVSATMPALDRAELLQSIASSKGFDWDDIEPVFSKIDEEIAELKEALVLAKQNTGSVESLQRVEDEYGDVLFSCVNLARFINVKPENALNRTNEKFLKRFQFIERYLFESNIAFEQASLEQLDQAWDQAKHQGL
jgi:uncharacterized protein YabN with tetrapyrrole methylase and pyrophosphatase domain